MDLTNALLSVVVALLGIIAWFLKHIYATLVANDRELFRRTGDLEKDVSAIKASCKAHHGGK